MSARRGTQFGSEAVTWPGLAIATLVVVAAAAMLAVLAAPARAQDFATAAPGSSIASPAALLERGLPPPASGASFTATFTTWYGLPDLTTRAAAAGLSVRSLRLAAGMSQTGDPALGWTAHAVGIGTAGSAGGAALRAVARRDRDPNPTRGVAHGDLGFEAGGGGWIEAAPGLRLWASAPQLWIRGAPPPLSRALEIGGSLAGDGVAFWIARAAGRAEAAAEHRAGLALGLWPLTAWVEVRDRPLRGGIGVDASLRGIGVSVSVDGHPVLGETVRMALNAVHAP